LKGLNKKKVLFVGSFKNSGGSGNVGGQMFACRSLIDSKLSEKVEWFLIDTTADSNIRISFTNRLFKASKRIVSAFFYLVFKKIDIALIFTSHGVSFLEKGLIAYLSKLFGAEVILAPRSGLMIKNMESSRFMNLYVKYVFKKSDYIVCQSKKWQIDFWAKTKVPLSKLIIIQNWIDTNTYLIKKNQQQKINILYLAWVDRNKGIFELIEALKILDHKVDYVLNIAGDGAAREEIVTLVNSLSLNNKVRMHGWVVGNQKIELLKKTDIFILPSYFEGFPNSLLESMAAGIACISTNVGSVDDIIVDNENGILIPLKDKMAIAKALSNLIKSPDLRLKLGNNARKSIEANNSIDSAVKKFYSLFKLG